MYPTTEWIEGIPTNVDSMFDRNQSNLILVDMMDDPTEGKSVSHLFTREQHNSLCGLS